MAKQTTEVVKNDTLHTQESQWIPSNIIFFNPHLQWQHGRRNLKISQGDKIDELQATIGLRTDYTVTEIAAGHNGAPSRY